MQKSPLISVITVCRNAADALERTISSVISQTFDDFEFIIVDGASTDSTPQILEKYSGSVNRIISEPDHGIYDAMNKGVNAATGRWVIFMNAADTFAAPDTMQRLAAEAMAAPDDTDVIYGNVLKKGPDAQPVLKEAEPPHRSHRMFFCHQSALTRRSALLTHPFDLRHPLSADFRLYRLLLADGRGFRKVNFPVAVFDTTGVSNSRRSAGLADNISVIMELDGLRAGLPHLMHLIPPYLICRLRGK
ncbi:MAG: glycosyltransferase [Muribaculaceae bacterium]|nr:glycosyltransferase [Muribaculaceae bacterium]